MAANQCLQNYKMIDKEIKVPNIGKFKDVEVIELLVSNGQSVSKNDTLITIESDKSSVEIPSLFKGKVKSLNIKVGDKVSEGSVILILESSEESKKDTKEQVKNEKDKYLGVAAIVFGRVPASIVIIFFIIPHVPKSL